MATELEALQAKHARLTNQLLALEAVMAHSEHLVLKSPAFGVGQWLRPLKWRAPRLERWDLRLQLERWDAGHGDSVRDEFRMYFERVDLFENFPRFLFCVLPPTREVVHP